MNEETHDMVLDEVNRLNDKLFNASKTTEEYMTLLMTASQFLLMGVITIATEHSEEPLEKIVEYFCDSAKKNIKKIVMEKKDDNSEE